MNAIQREVETLRLADAESFFAVTIHRDAQGNPVPTITVVAEGAARDYEEEFQVRLRGIAETLRKAFVKR